MTDIERAYREHADGLFRYLGRLGRDEALARDILHDTFIRLADRPPRSAENLRAWLFSVATNRLRDVERVESRRVELLREHEPWTMSDGPPPVERRLEEREARERLDRLLAALPQRDRQSLVLREAGLTHREIARVVGTTTGSIGTMLSRALERVASLLRSQLGSIV